LKGARAGPGTDPSGYQPGPGGAGPSGTLANPDVI